MVIKALNKIKNEYKSRNKTTHQVEFERLEKNFTSELDKSAISWIKNFYDCKTSSREVFNYLESKL